MNRSFMPLGLLLTIPTVAQAQPPRRPTPADLEKRAAALMPSPELLRFQQIPWVHELARAQQVARAEMRPLFLWGYGGRNRPEDLALEGC